MVAVGDRIRIDKLEDRWSKDYSGREGFVEYIDSLGQLHGTWGGLAVIPEIDEISIYNNELGNFVRYQHGDDY